MNKGISPSNRFAWQLIQEGSNYDFSSVSLRISTLPNCIRSKTDVRQFLVCMCGPDRFLTLGDGNEVGC